MRGIGQVRLLFMIEPKSPSQHRFPLAEFREFLRANFARFDTVVNERRLNCLDNTRAGMDKAFELGAEFAVLAEEDIAVADDVLEYFAWAQRFRDDPEVAVVCAHTFRSAAAESGKAVRVKWFSPLVWGTWPGEWKNFIRPDWGGLTGNPQAWDLNLRLQLVHADKFSIFPVRSRSLHCGHASTLTALPLASYFYDASLTDCFDPHYEPQDWAEIQRAREYGLVVLWRAGTGPGGGPAARTSHGSEAIRGSWKARGYQTAAPGGDTSCTAPPGWWSSLSSCAWATS